VVPLDREQIAAGIDSVLDSYGGFIDDALATYSMAPNRSVVAARIWVETRGNPNVVSREGEIGLLQLSKATMAQYHVTQRSAKNPRVNISVGTMLWHKWTSSLRVWMYGQGLPNPGTVTWPHMALLSWLTTAIGPGAIRGILTHLHTTDMDAIRELADDMSTLRTLERYWGNQSPSLISHRIKVAYEAVAAATTKESGTMTIAMAIGLGLLAAFGALLTFWFLPN
jgi:hypothetical protein